MCRADPDRPPVCEHYTWAFISEAASMTVIREFDRMIPSRSGFAFNGRAPWYFRDADHHPVLAAYGFFGLLDGDVENAPKAGGFDATTYWTGANSSGHMGASCHGWDRTTDDWFFSARVGNSAYKTGYWLSHWRGAYCDTHRPVLCACF